jgi:hypothetical protein
MANIPGATPNRTTAAPEIVQLFLRTTTAESFDCRRSSVRKSALNVFERMVAEQARELKRTVGTLKAETIRHVSITTFRGGRY